MNAFWSKVNIGGQQGTWTTDIFEDNKTFNIYLTNAGVGATTSTTEVNGATLTQAIQCALANIIAFSSILGKAGPLQAWILSLFGTFGYVLNKKVIFLLGLDYGGTFSIFTFGGFLGLFLGIMLNFKYKGERQTGRSQHYTGKIFSVTLSLMGNLIVWALFPILVMDPRQIFVQNFQLYTVPLNIIFSIAGSTITSLGISLIINEKVLVRDVIQAPTAGAVAIASASYYITNPVNGIAIGCTAGLIQSLLQNFLEKNVSKKNNIINTFSFVVFGIQGIIGSVFASGFRSALDNGGTNNLPVNFSILRQPIFGFVIAVISAGIGIIFGIFIGIFLFLAAKHQKKAHFQDFTYWVDEIEDGISYDRKNKQSTQDYGEIYIYETNENIKMKHAYL